MKSPNFILACLAGAGVMLGACSGLAQSPTITGVYPDGASQFQYTPALSFTASSSSSVTNVTVTLTQTRLGGLTFVKNLSLATGLTSSGPLNNRSISAPLDSNLVYSAAIKVMDATGASASTTVNFDTMNPILVVEAEDWDYNGGHFFDYPETNAYANLTSVMDVDYHNTDGNSAYRPRGMGNETCSDKPRPAYINTGFTDYDLGWTDDNDWANYTRHFPSGTYNVFIRAASPNHVDQGGATISGAMNGVFNVVTTGDWQKYQWFPLVDANSNMVQFAADGSQQTMTWTITHGGYNVNYFMFLPLPPPAPASTVSVINVYPNGTNQFQATNQFVFDITSAVGVSLADVTLQLTATTLDGQKTTTLFTPDTGLTVTGNSMNWHASVPVTTNLTYTAIIGANENNGSLFSTNITFDTVIPFYTFEAEDYDYSSGQYVPDPQTNGYYLLNGVEGVDFHWQAPSGPIDRVYRTTGQRIEYAGDVARDNHFGTDDYDNGNVNGGDWANYTRNFPAGTFNLYVRAARGSGGTQSDAASVYQVISGVGTANQTTSKIGTYDVPSTGDWQKYGFTPVKDAAGNLARFTGGGVKTLRCLMDNGGHNQNYFLLMPATGPTPPPFMTDFAPDGSALFQPSNTLSFTANSAAGIQQSGVKLNLNGVDVSGLHFSGSSSVLSVSYPIQTNGSYTAIVTLTDSVGTTKFTNVFNTYSPNNYQLEVEDYDYNGGQYKENQWGAYANLGSVADVDNHQSDLGANPFNYRANSTANPAPSTTTSGDRTRAQFGSAVDYNIGFFGGGSWCNYTRHYPAGTYYVIGRFAEGGGNTEAILAQVTSGYGTSTQTTNILGEFFIAQAGWGTWEWAPLMDGSNSKMAKITLDGNLNTLRLAGTPLGHPEVNVNFLMLVPTTSDLVLKVVKNGNSWLLSFPTVTGSSYQVQYKNHLTDANWSTLGSSVSGNGSVQSVTDTAAQTSRFYRVLQQIPQ